MSRPLPPYLIGALLLFWGVHIGYWWVGLAFGLLAELPRVVGWRWALSAREFERISDLCSLLLVITAVAFYLGGHAASAAMGTVRWAPALLFPLLAAQLYAGRDGIPLSALFWTLRGDRSGRGPGGDTESDQRLPYLLLCLLAAAMVEVHTPWYYPALAGFALWGLWPRGRRIWPALLLFAVAAGGGYAISLGLQATQRAVADQVVEWLIDRYAGDRDPFRATTAIGEIGELKGSERIVLRVWPEARLSRPLLLRTAGYNRYINGAWYTSREPFTRLPRVEGAWRLGRGAGEGTASLSLALYLNEGEGILPLPGAVEALRGLTGADLSRNPMGAVKVLEGPPLAILGARFSPGRVHGSPPGEAELQVPAAERVALQRVVERLGLTEVAPAEAMARLERFFLDQFRYTLALTAGEGAATPLAHFLGEGRSGHCEYFATATTLLLRQAGIPARYAVGWSIQERGADGVYVARARHAHAWSQVWLDGAWRDFDTTPPDWGALEAEGAPWWTGARDWLSRLRFRLDRWRAEEEGEERRWMWWLLLPLVMVLGWRLARHRRVAKGRAGRQREVDPLFAPLELHLAAIAGPRRVDETPLLWLDRLEREAGFDGASLRPLLEAYHRYRYDPSVAVETRTELEARIGRWLQSSPDL